MSRRNRFLIKFFAILILLVSVFLELDVLNVSFLKNVDFGNTYIDHTDMRLDNIAVAVGFGFMYYTDIIPIRIDFGFKAYDPSDPRNFFTRLNDPNVGLGDLLQFHFAIGEAF